MFFPTAVGLGTVPYLYDAKSCMCPGLCVPNPDHKSCENCDAGMEPNADGTECKKCIGNTFSVRQQTHPQDQDHRALAGADIELD